MGWGILFAGYVFLLSIPMHAVGVCAELVGYILMFRALSLLGVYEKHFLRARLVCCLLMPFGAYALFEQCMRWLGFDAVAAFCADTLTLPVSIALAVLLLIFHYFLLNGVRRLAVEVSLPDIVRQAVRNQVIAVLYFVLTIALSFMNVPVITEKISYASLAGIVSMFGIVWIILNAKMFFNCYMWICMPDDLDMPMHDRKTPRIFSREPEKVPDPEEEKRLAFAKADAEAKARQEMKTKKNKRHKHR